MRNLLWRFVVSLLVTVIPGSFRVGFLRRFKILGGIGHGVLFSTTNLGTEPGLIFIGDNTVIAAGVRFVTHDLSTRVFSDGEFLGDLFGEIHIGNNCAIGSDTILMPNVRISDGVIVGAGAIVTKSIQSPGVYVGVGPRKVADLADYKSGAAARQAQSLVLADKHPDKFIVDKGKLVKQRPFI